MRLASLIALFIPAFAAACASPAEYRVAATDAPVPAAALAPPPTSGIGSELRGAVLRVATPDGRVENEVRFHPDGRAVIIPRGRTASLEGRWTVVDDRLCLDWAPRGRECWPYGTALQPGRAVDVTSDRGQTLRVTLLSNTLGG